MASAEELKAIEQLTISIGKQMDMISDKSDKRNKKLSVEANSVKEITSSISSQQDAIKANIALEERLLKIQNTKFGVNQKLKKELLNQTSASNEAVKIRGKEFAVTERVASLTDSLTNSIESGIDSLSHKINHIPVIGSIIAKPLNSLKGKFSEMGNHFKERVIGKFFELRSTGLSVSKSITQSLKYGFSQISKMAPILLNPYVLLGAAISAAIGAGLYAMWELVSASRDYRKETGLTISQTKGIEETIKAAYSNTKFLGASLEDVTNAAVAFTTEFGGLEPASKNTLTSMTMLNKNFGIILEDAAKVNKIFQNISGLTESQAQHQVEFVAELATASNIAPRKIMADITESVGEAAGFFRGNTKELIKQATYARAMGSTLKDVANVSRGLLDYQNSISNEMEASAILGTNLNFSQSRYLAAQGDIIGAQREMVKQLRNTVDLDRASIFEREAIEKATGMQFEQLQNMARLQEKFPNIEKERLAAAQSLLNNGVDVKTMTDEQITAESERLKNMQDMQDIFQKLQNRITAIGSTILFAFQPLGKIIVDTLDNLENPNFSYITSTFSTIKDIVMAIWPVVKVTFNTLVSSVSAFFKQLKPAMDELRTSLEPVIAIVKDVFQSDETSQFMNLIVNSFKIIGKISSTILITAFRVIGTIVSTTYDIFKSIFDFFSGDIGFGEMISNIMDSMMERWLTLPQLLWDGFKTILSDIGEYFYNQIKSQFSLLSGIFGDGDTIKVNDAVISPSGDVVSTSPNDWLIATQTPNQLAGGTSSNSMGEVVKELKELKNAFLSNKDVYIDRDRVTSTITTTQEKSSRNNFGLLGA